VACPGNLHNFKHTFLNVIEQFAGWWAASNTMSVTSSLLIKQEAKCVLQQSMYVFRTRSIPFFIPNWTWCLYTAVAYRFIVAELILLEIVTERFNACR